MSDLTLDDINRAVVDSAYAAVGFGVLSFQRAQVRRRELTEQLQKSPGAVESAREQLAQVARLVDEQVSPVRKQVGGQLDELESRLPASTRNVVSSFRQSVRAPESHLRSAIGLKDQPTA